MTKFLEIAIWQKSSSSWGVKRPVAQLLVLTLSECDNVSQLMTDPPKKIKVQCHLNKPEYALKIPVNPVVSTVQPNRIITNPWKRHFQCMLIITSPWGSFMPNRGTIIQRYWKAKTIVHQLINSIALNVCVLQQHIHCLELHLDAAASNKQNSRETLHLFIRLPKCYFAISFVPQTMPQRGDLFPGACVFQYQQRGSLGKE